MCRVFDSEHQALPQLSKIEATSTHGIRIDHS